MSFYRKATNSEIKFYQSELYPLQDRVFAIASQYERQIYLTGGTALSRFYYRHRLSEDLDFFTTTNNLKLIALWDFPPEDRIPSRYSHPVLKRRLNQLPLPERQALAKMLARSAPD